jgi:hypothetical protein
MQRAKTCQHLNPKRTKYFSPAKGSTHSFTEINGFFQGLAKNQNIVTPKAVMPYGY